MVSLCLQCHYVNNIFCVIILVIPCDYYPPPINGGVLTTPFLNGAVVTPKCNAGYDFATKLAAYYQCYFGIWYIPPEFQMPWPDCTGTNIF